MFIKQFYHKHKQLKNLYNIVLRLHPQNYVRKIKFQNNYRLLTLSYAYKNFCFLFYFFSKTNFYRNTYYNIFIKKIVLVSFFL